MSHETATEIERACFFLDGAAELARHMAESPSRVGEEALSLLCRCIEAEADRMRAVLEAG